MYYYVNALVMKTLQGREPYEKIFRARSSGYLHVVYDFVRLEYWNIRKVTGNIENIEENI